MAETLNILGHERCRFLTHKEMFYRETDIGPAGPRSSSGHFWCSLTQTIQGPDGALVEHQKCKPGRSCYSGV